MTVSKPVFYSKVATINEIFYNQMYAKIVASFAHFLTIKEKFKFAVCAP